MSEPYEDFEHDGSPEQWPETGPAKTAFFGSAVSFNTTDDGYEAFDDEWPGLSAPATPDGNSFVLAAYDDATPSTLVNSGVYGNGFGVGAVTMAAGKWGNSFLVNSTDSDYAKFTGSGPGAGSNYWDEGTVEFYYKPRAMSEMYPGPGHPFGDTHVYFLRLVPNDGTSAGLYIRISYWSGDGLIRFIVNWTWNMTSAISVAPYDPATHFAIDKWTPVKVTWSKAADEMLVYIDDSLFASAAAGWNNSVPDTNSFALYQATYGPGNYNSGLPGYYEELHYSDIVRP